MAVHRVSLWHTVDHFDSHGKSISIDGAACSCLTYELAHDIVLSLMMSLLKTDELNIDKRAGAKTCRLNHVVVNALL
jgi:hypothetical protein